MGAHNFEVWGRGKTAKEAYDNAVADALYEEGHNPYNGTISTTNSFIMIELTDGESLEEWRDRVTMDDRVQKWENCGCVKHPDKEPDGEGRDCYCFAGCAAS